MYASGGKDKGGNGLTHRTPGDGKVSPSKPPAESESITKALTLPAGGENPPGRDGERGRRGREKVWLYQERKTRGEIVLTTRARPTWLAEVPPFLKTSGKSQEQKPYSTLGPS